jgi:hypothetical protein
MRTYIKNVFKFEKYISVVNSDNDRVSMTRFRNSNHQLQIEIGRYTIPKTPINVSYTSTHLSVFVTEQPYKPRVNIESIRNVFIKTS